MSNKKGAVNKIVIGVLSVMIVCVGIYIAHLFGESEQPPVAVDAPKAVVTPEQKEPLQAEPAPIPTPETVPTVSSDSENVASIAPVVAETGFTLVNEEIYVAKPAVARDHYDSDGKSMGSLKQGEQLYRVGIGYGEAEGWSRVMLLSGKLAYVENEYLSLEPLSGDFPVFLDKETDLALEDFSISELLPNEDSNTDTGDSTSKPEVNINSGKNNSTSQSKPVNNQSSSTQNGSSQGSESHGNSDFLKDAMLKDAETGNTVDRIDRDPGLFEVDTDHDYSGITISP